MLRFTQWARAAKVGSASGSQVVVLDVHGDDFQGTLAEHFKGSATSHWVLLRSEGVLYARKSSQTRWSVAGPATGLGLSVRPFLSLGFPELDEESPADASQEIMHMTPQVATTVATLLTATYLFTNHRRQVQARVEAKTGKTGGK